MQLDDFNITAEYMEYSDSSNKSEWGEPLPCWIKYESESKELSIKFEYEQEGKPNTYVWFKDSRYAHLSLFSRAKIK